MAYSTDNDYNALSRTVLIKIALYLDGPTQAPLEVTRDDYLVSINLLEEATSNNTIFGNVSSNEISIVLQNTDNRFSPTNAQSPYYGKMAQGKLVKVYASADAEDDWYPFYTGYISDWSASVSGLSATIIADDAFYNIFGRKPAEVQPQLSESIADFLTRYFNVFSITPTVDPTLQTVLPIAYAVSENKKTISDLATAMFSICNVDHSGTVRFRNLHTAHQCRATFTDADQVLKFNAELSITAAYSAAQLTYKVPYISSDTRLFAIDESQLTSGSNVVTYQLENAPLYRLKHITINNEQSPIQLTEVHCTSLNVSLALENPYFETVPVKVAIVGQYIATALYEVGSEGDNTLSVNNVYIQSAEQATAYYAVLQRFIQNLTPVLKVSVRGNPLIEIGDKIRVSSTKYNIDFTGFVMRQKFTYNGGLSCDMTLLNASLLEDDT